MNTVIRNGHLIDPAHGIDQQGDILIQNGEIQAVGQVPDVEATIFDAAGQVVAPGFFDLHVHLREPGTEEAETIKTGGEAAVAGGFTAVAAMPNTHPPTDSAATARFVVEEGRRNSPAHIFPIGAVTKGQKGETLAEIGEMVEAGIVGVSDDGKPVMDARLFRRAMEYSRLFNLPVIQHCEDLDLSGKGVMNEGETSTRLGLQGIPAAAEDTMVARDLILTGLTEAKYHVAHLSTAAAVGMVREAKARGLAVTAEVTPHHFTLTDAAVGEYDTNAKMKPPLRTDADVQALIEGLRDGTIDAIATDHAPHHANLKMLDFDQAPFGITGLETAVGLALTRLDLPMTRIIELFSTNPQRIMRVKPWGLFRGSRADLTIVNPDKEWTFDVKTSRSLGRNTPFDGWKMRGQATTTIVEGRIVHENH